MSNPDVIVVGAGISGLVFAESAGRSGRSVLVLEQSSTVGGCIATHRGPAGYWFELGAHTCYNSYAGLAEIIDRCGIRERVIARAKTRLRFLDGDELVGGSNMGVLLRLFSWGELARSLPRMFTEKKEGQTVYSYYSHLVGRRNYDLVLGPMLSAVPSQSADAFPAGMLFKSRDTRRKDYPRSFTIEGGLSSVAETLAAQPQVTARTGVRAVAIEPAGRDLVVVTEEGERHQARVVALAAPPSVSAALLRGVAPELAIQVARVKEATVDSLGFAVRADRIRLPVSTFLVPREDTFHSVVTRDPVPDRDWRGFAFHFKPGATPEARLERATRLLKLAPADLEDLTERRAVLPSPVLGHDEVVREIDRLSAGSALALTGNWFGGLSIEDCVERSRREWERIEKLS